jgi:hypothetical protein
MEAQVQLEVVVVLEMDLQPQVVDQEVVRHMEVLVRQEHQAKGMLAVQAPQILVMVVVDQAVLALPHQAIVEVMAV